MFYDEVSSECESSLDSPVRIPRSSNRTKTYSEAVHSGASSVRTPLTSADTYERMLATARSTARMRTEPAHNLNIATVTFAN